MSKHRSQRDSKYDFSKGVRGKYAQRYAESELLNKIYQGVPVKIQQRYNELIARREIGILSEDEYGELLHLTDQIEKLDAERLEHLAALALLRRTSLTSLIQKLGIASPTTP